MFQLAMFPLIESSTGMAKGGEYQRFAEFSALMFSSGKGEENSDCCRWHFPVWVKKENWELEMGGGGEREESTNKQVEA